MPVNTTEIIELLSKLAEEERLGVTIKESVKGGLIAGGMTVAGGLLLGPIGFVIGGVIGGCAAYANAQGKFVSAVEVIATMQPEQREHLAQNIRRIMESIDVTDITLFAAMLAAGDSSIKKKVMFALVDYLKTEMSMAIVDH